MTDWFDDQHGELDLAEQRRPLAPTHLLPRERWLWWEQLWSDVCALRVRYRLAVRSGWWEDQVQVEALAAMAAWSSATTQVSGMTRPGSSRCSTTSNGFVS